MIYSFIIFIITCWDCWEVWPPLTPLAELPNWVSPLDAITKTEKTKNSDTNFCLLSKFWWPIISFIFFQNLWEKNWDLCWNQSGFIVFEIWKKKKKSMNYFYIIKNFLFCLIFWFQELILLVLVSFLLIISNILNSIQILIFIRISSYYASWYLILESTILY